MTSPLQTTNPASDDAPSAATSRPTPVYLRVLVTLFTVPLLLGLTGWGVLMLHFAGPSIKALNYVFLGAYALTGFAAIVALLLWRWPGRALLAFLGAFFLAFAWWSSIRPSNNRQWQPEVERLCHATVEGDLVTFHNIRNFDYRTETDFTKAYYDKTFDVRKLERVDLIACYWAGPAIAHTFLSFGFEGGGQLAASIETRKEVGESYSTLGGFFRQYELYYVVADERDVIRLRTNFRKDPPEEVYLYRVQAPIDNGRRLFLDYVKSINALNEVPEFYNTLTTNCTTTIWTHARMNPGHPPLSWKILLSGHVPEYLYEVGRLDTTVPFAVLKERSQINSRALEAGAAEDFSQRIRIEAPSAPAKTP